MANLVTVDLTSNFCGATIWGDWSSTECSIVILGHNGSKGSIPEEISKLKLLEEVFQYCAPGIYWQAGKSDSSIHKGCGLTGNFLRELETNMLSGSIPVGICQVKSLQHPYCTTII